MPKSIKSKGGEKIKTIKLKDEGQDFLELDIMENGVIRGYSIMFSEERLSLLGIGSLNGTVYYPLWELKESNFARPLKGLYIYIKKTGEKDPLPWKTQTLKYKII